MLQEVGGTPTTRDPNKWIGTAFSKIKGVRVVFSDVRYPNEAEAIRNYYKERSGICRIYRPGVGPANSHASETELDTIRPDFIINNDDAISNLTGRVHRLVKFLENKGELL